jgi:hypothetical protein
MERVAEDTAKRYGGYYTHYFSNDDNPEYHRRVTGPQIYKNAGDAIDAIVIGVGSGGTITGVAEYIKAWNSMVRIVAVEPAECAAISGGFIGQHGISGIGPGFVPENYNPYVVDTVLTVTTADAERAAREVLAHTDLVLADLKFSSEDGYRAHTGGSLAHTLDFLALTQELGVPLWVRHVVIPGLTDGEAHIRALARMAGQFHNLQKVELLGFRKLCLEKYGAIGVPFPLADTPEMDAAALCRLEDAVRRELPDLA